MRREGCFQLSSGRPRNVQTQRSQLTALPSTAVPSSISLQACLSLTSGSGLKNRLWHRVRCCSAPTVLGSTQILVAWTPAIGSACVIRAFTSRCPASTRSGSKRATHWAESPETGRDALTPSWPPTPCHRDPPRITVTSIDQAPATRCPLVQAAPDPTHVFPGG